MRSGTFNKVLKLCATVMFGGLLASWILYGLFGASLIEALYKSESPIIVTKVMAGRDSTPLAAYYVKADRLMWIGTFYLALPLLVLVILLNDPVGVALVTGSLIFCFFLLFCFIEAFPSFIPSFALNQISYFGYKECCIPDRALIFQEKPFFSGKTVYRGNQYSPLYGDTSPILMEWKADRNGFRNNSITGSSDVIVLGDSFIAFALNDADSFGKKLETISGLTVANLGVAGYGPFQYLEILKRYGIERRPKYALFSFYAGNDLIDTSDYLQGQDGKAGFFDTAYALSGPFLKRYIIALATTIRYFANIIQLRTKLASAKIHLDPNMIHPSVAEVDLAGKHHRMLLTGGETRPTDEILNSPEGLAIRNIFTQFKSACIENDILPIIMFIPEQVFVYAEYTTENSGRLWLDIRSRQIAAKANTEKAIIRLAEELGVELINLSPLFDSEVKRGRSLYYPFDTHWNSEGREVAAELVAERLKDQGRPD